MSTFNTDLNINPYYSDYDPEKQYYRVLFKPSVALQARELSEIQELFGNQLSQLGDHVFQNGSIVKGVNLTQLNKLKYVKLGDKTGFKVSDYFGQSQRYYLWGQNSGLKAEIFYGTPGFLSQDPDLNTFYIQYSNTVSGISEFIAGETLSIRNESEQEVGTINVASSAFSNVTGDSYGVSCSEGIIYQRGAFIYVVPQIVIASKYSDQPNNVSVGFVVNEKIVDYLTDQELLDNSFGFNNENAPGADRLKVSPVLTSVDTDSALTSSDFFVLIRFVDGQAVQIRDLPQYNELGDEFAKRTYEENGNFVVSQFDVQVDKRIDITGSSNNEYLYAKVGEGVAYVEGFRVETTGEQFIEIDQHDPDVYESTENELITAYYGSHVFVLANTVQGNTGIDIEALDEIQIHDVTNAYMGTARVRNIVNVNDEMLHYYLFDIRLKDSNTYFSDATTLRDTSNTIIAEIDTSSIPARIKKSEDDILIYDLGTIGVRDVTSLDYVARKFDSWTSPGGANNTFTLTLTDPDETFPYADGTSVGSTEFLVMDDDNNNFVKVTGITISGGSKTAAITLDPSTTVNSGYVYYNVTRSTSQGASKLDVNAFVNIVYEEGVSDYTLGLPDVYKINSIVDASNSEIDYTNSFSLVPNQKDTFYDLSFVRKQPMTFKPNDGDVLTVNMQVFRQNTSSGFGYYTVSSYPSSDFSNIPTYTSSQGINYDLRNCIDFRPVVANNVSYSANAASADTANNDSVGITFVPSTVATPQVNSTLSVDYEYYQGRVDALTLNAYGEFRVEKGAQQDEPSPPSIPENVMKIADIYVPSYPALTIEEAEAKKKINYAVRLKRDQHKRYTMKDIQELEERLNQLEYFVSLSALEKEASDKTILDEFGIELFKSGILVDSFSDLSKADLTDRDFFAGIDSSVERLQPAVRQFALPLVPDLAASTDISLYDDVVTRSSNGDDVAIISQPYATKIRNAVANFSVNVGNGKLMPEYDFTYDVVVPAKHEVTLGRTNNRRETSPAASTSRFSHAFQPLTTVDPRGKALTVTVGDIEGASATKNLAPLNSRRFIDARRITDDNIVRRVANYIKSNNNPYMRARRIQVLVRGLKANTRHYFFFDGKDVNNNVAPGKIFANKAVRVKNVVRSGIKGSAVTSDAKGRLKAVFYLPAGSFSTGEKLLEIMDVSSYSLAKKATSICRVPYNTYNYSADNDGTRRDSILFEGFVGGNDRASGPGITENQFAATGRPSYVDSNIVTYRDR